MPSISWLTARDEIVSILAGLSITDPTAMTLKRIYENPRQMITDLPCVIIVGVTKADPVRSSGMREREYTVRLRLLVEDADINRQEAMIDAFQEAIIDAFDQNLSLNGKVSNLNGPQWLEAGTLEGGGQHQAGSDAFVRFRMFDDPTFAG